MAESLPRRSWLDGEPPADPSFALAYWCEVGYLLAHTAYGDHPPCECPKEQGHNDPRWEEFRVAA